MYILIFKGSFFLFSINTIFIAKNFRIREIRVMFKKKYPVCEIFDKTYNSFKSVI